MAKKKSSLVKRPGKRAKAWTDYEEVARYVLKQLGKRFRLAEVEGKQKVLGRRSGTDWEIDAKGVREGDSSIVIVECRLYRKRLTQEALASVAYRIIDTGATGGITVSPLPLQRGAAKVASSSKIEHVQLRPDSTRESWVAEIDKVIHMGMTEAVSVTVTDSFEISIRDVSGNVVEQRSG